MAGRAKPISTAPRSYQMSAAALDALEQMRMAWKAHKWQILEQAVLRLHRDWREGKARGVFLITDTDHSSSGGEE